MDRSELASAVEALTGERAASIAAVPGGRNNRIFRARCESGRDLAVKVYFRNAGDPRDRLGTEFRAATLMAGHGLNQAPAPVAMCADRGIGVYEFVEGVPVDSSQAADADIDACVAFLAALNKLSREPTARDMPPASEACFSAAAILESLRGRLGRLDSLPCEQADYAEMRRFLGDEFTPALGRFTGTARQTLAASGIAMDYELASDERTLSPSDFGFHNCLRRPDGRLVFLDFEYFGWDDPAKTASDFLLHPGMSLTADAKRRFLSAFLDRIDDDGRVASRLAGVYPLWGLKWCLIILNEFLAEHSDRRRFALGDAESGRERRTEQLGKSRRLLAALNERVTAGAIEEWIR